LNKTALAQTFAQLGCDTTLATGIYTDGAYLFGAQKQCYGKRLYPLSLQVLATLKRSLWALRSIGAINPVGANNKYGYSP
jgi:hypothetical protein